ncbi:uncharacterized protein LOC144139066 [Haemaphysalis longicornis]
MRSSLNDSEDGCSPVQTPDVASMETSTTSEKTKRKRKHHRRGSGSAGGSRHSSRLASLQSSLISSDGKVKETAAGSKSPSELLPVPVRLSRRPSTDSKISNPSNRPPGYVGDEPKVPPALDTFSREHSSMAESPPPAPVPTVVAGPTAAASGATN